MPSSKILVVGSCIIDFISYVQRLPKVGETIQGREFKTGFGGKGANQAVAAAKLGTSVAMVAKVGDDVTWGAKYLDNFRQQGVDTRHVQTVAGRTTGIAQIIVSNAGENQIVIVTGANDDLSPDDVEKADELFREAEVLILQLETAHSVAIAALRRFPKISILNAAPGFANLPKEILTLPSIFCVNEIEAEITSGVRVGNVVEAKTALLKLLEMGCRSVIITLGAEGAIYGSNEKHPKEVLHVKAPKIERVIDTTGAGDAFIGALAHVMATYPKLTMQEKIGAACWVASLSTQKCGTQSSFPRVEELDFSLDNVKVEWNSI